MKNRRSIHPGARVILGLALVLGYIVCAVGQEVRTFSGEGEALAAIKMRYGIVLGIEASGKNPKLVQNPITLHLPPGDAFSTFEELIAQLPNCVWELRDGVYDVRPRREAASILEQKVASFSVVDASPAEAADAIARLLEVKRWLDLHGIARREIETGAMALAGQSEGRATLSMRNVTLRTILNNLAKQFPSQQWSVVRYGDKGQYLGIYL